MILFDRTVVSIFINLRPISPDATVPGSSRALADHFFQRKSFFKIEAVLVNLEGLNFQNFLNNYVALTLAFESRRLLTAASIQSE